MASRWFQPQYYFDNKLAQVRESTGNQNYSREDLVRDLNANGYRIDGDTTVQIDAAADQLERHFFDYGMKENVSPNGFFDVATYKANKLAQLATTNQQPPEGYSEWNDQALDRAMEIAHLSYWEHYLNHGMTEDINPSAQFDTSDYITAKRIQLNSLQPPQPLPEGFEGTEWTNEAVIRAFQIANLNPIQHYEDYVKNGPEHLDGFSTGEEPAPDAPEMPLTTEVDTFNDGGVAKNFVATVSPFGSTLQGGDQITATSPDTQLTVDLSTAWAGFTTGSVKDVQTINVNGGAEDFTSFSAKGITGAKTYNVKGNVSLQDLGADATNINLTNVTQSGILIEYAKGLMSGESDSVSLGLNNVYTQTTNADGDVENGPVRVILNNVEDVKLVSIGEATNEVDLSGVLAMTSLSVAGSAAVNVSAVDVKLSTIDATNAAGAVSIDATNARSLTGATLGSGDDTLTVDSLASTATVNGGTGSDTLEFAGRLSSSTYNLTTTGVEAVKFSNTSSVTFSGKNAAGVEEIVLNNQSKGVTLTNFTDQSLDVTAMNSNGAILTAPGVSSLNLTVGDGSDTTADTFGGTLKLADATSLSVALSDTSATAPVFNGKIDGKNLQSLYIDAESEGSSFTLGSGSSLKNVTQIEASGAGEVDLSAVTDIGSSAQSLFVQASSVEGGFKGVFNGSAKASNLFVSGATQSANNITVGSNYDFVQITGGTANDTVYLDVTDVDALKNYNIELGGGNDTIFVKTASVKTELQKMVGSDVKVLGPTDPVPPANIAGSNMTLPTDASGKYDLPAGDYSLVTPPSSSYDMTYAAGTANEPTKIGAITTNTTVTTAGTDEASVTFTGTADGTVNLVTTTGAAPDLPSSSGPTSADTESLTVTNDGTGTVTIKPDLTASKAYGVSNVTSLDVASNNANGSVVIGEAQSNGAIGSIFPFVDEVNFTGNGDVVVNAQLGVNSNLDNNLMPTSLTINASELNASVTFGESAIAVGNNITYTGTNHGDTLNFNCYSNDNQITLGTGEDTVQFNACINKSGRQDAVIDLDLQSDGVEDTVQIAAIGTGYGHTVLNISGFDVSTDGIALLAAADGTGTSQDTKVLSAKGTAGADGFTAAQFNFALTNLGLAAIDTALITASTTSNVVYVEQGTDTYNAYMFLSGDSAGSGASTFATDGGSANGVTMVVIEGVDANTYGQADFIPA